MTAADFSSEKSALRGRFATAYRPAEGLMGRDSADSLIPLLLVRRTDLFVTATRRAICRFGDRAAVTGVWLTPENSLTPSEATGRYIPLVEDIPIMAEKTRRDRVWSYILTMTYRQEKSVTSEQVAEYANVSERTARETLHVMESDYFIQRKRKGGKVVYQKPSEGLSG